MPRVTGPLLKVLQVFLADPAAETYGLEIMRETGLKSGTLYPLLDRMVDDGWVERRWEENDPSEAGRPRRRIYRLTSAGAHEARFILSEYGIGDPAWNRS